VNNIRFALQPFEILWFDTDRGAVQHAVMFATHRTMAMREPFIGAGNFEAHGATKTRTLIHVDYLYTPVTLAQAGVQ
jgi:hypothetical protein